jgi:patatin-like phospholipase/acyl hydrolase
MGKKIKILSIDGGGVRGIIPARVMQAIEEKAGKPLSELFDYFVGTSTGGLLALGVATPDKNGKPKYTAAEGVQFFFQYGHEIFPQHWWNNFRQIYTYKYKSAPFEAILREWFGNMTMGDCLKDTLITSYATNMARPKFFKSWDEYDRKFAVHDVARATSAAPTFFEPVQLMNGNYKVTLVDGGVFANNPAMCGLSDAKKRSGDIMLDDYMVVSLGAGETDYSFTRGNVVYWGAIQWMTGLRILHLFLDGSVDAVSYQLREMLGKGDFYRLQIPLTEKLSSMDDSRNIPELLKMGEALIKEQDAILDEIVEKLL